MYLLQYLFIFLLSAVTNSFLTSFGLKLTFFFNISSNTSSVVPITVTEIIALCFIRRNSSHYKALSLKKAKFSRIFTRKWAS